jgi:hypothetical protein
LCAEGGGGRGGRAAEELSGRREQEEGLELGSGALREERCEPLGEEHGLRHGCRVRDVTVRLGLERERKSIALLRTLRLAVADSMRWLRCD